jgi:hypothetical protein
MLKIHYWITNMHQYQSLGIKEKVYYAKEILNLNYNIIGHGRHRIVYMLTNKYALKVALTPFGLINNKTEFDLYISFPHLRNNLCAVHDYGWEWIIMSLMSRKVPATKKNRINLSKLKKRFVKAGIIPKDLKRNNLAMSETGEIVVLDYGNFIMKP